eukprot:TRINITY_DN5224_c0_g1_i2.p1 TRINITY_DN5224_c0_g1~~TRINITY_DN5224_c0_g1_i2.p1  ORF type:complete len:130 (-),score=44.38 TRINITY_DN5224_c0_g1_i2:49-438(-)
MDRVNDMAVRILTPWYLLGQDSKFPAVNFNAFHPEQSKMVNVAGSGAAKFSVFSPELVGEVNVPEEILRNYILLVSNGSIDIKRWSKRDRQLKRYTVEDIFGQTTIHPGTFGASLVGVFMFVMMRRRGF